MKKDKKGSWLKARMVFDPNVSVEETIERYGAESDHGVQHATKWHNRLPICPYGCGQEGQFVEVIFKEDGTAVGIYKDSEQLIFTFTADVVLNPSPKKRELRLVNGEYQYVEVEG